MERREMVHVYMWFGSGAYEMHGNQEKREDAKELALEVKDANAHNVGGLDGCSEVIAVGYGEQKEKRQYKVTTVDGGKIGKKGTRYHVEEVDMTDPGGTKSCGYFKVAGRGDPP